MEFSLIEMLMLVLVLYLIHKAVFKVPVFSIYIAACYLL